MNKKFEKSIEVCAHAVEIRYWNIHVEVTDEVAELLEEEGARRAKECITEGIVSGELNCPINDTEVCGWWEIV